MCLAGAVLASRSLTQGAVGSNPFSNDKYFCPKNLIERTRVTAVTENPGTGVNDGTCA